MGDFFDPIGRAKVEQAGGENQQHPGWFHPPIENESSRHQERILIPKRKAPVGGQHQQQEEHEVETVEEHAVVFVKVSMAGEGALSCVQEKFPHIRPWIQEPDDPHRGTCPGSDWDPPFRPHAGTRLLPPRL